MTLSVDSNARKCLSVAILNYSQEIWSASGLSSVIHSSLQVTKRNVRLRTPPPHDEWGSNYGTLRMTLSFTVPNHFNTELWLVSGDLGGRAYVFVVSTTSRLVWELESWDSLRFSPLHRLSQNTVNSRLRISHAWIVKYVMKLRSQWDSICIW